VGARLHSDIAVGVSAAGIEARRLDDPRLEVSIFSSFLSLSFFFLLQIPPRGPWAPCGPKLVEEGGDPRSVFFTMEYLFFFPLFSFPLAPIEG